MARHIFLTFGTMALVGLSAIQVQAQEAPKLRTIERVVVDANAQASTEAAVGSKEKTETAAAKPPARSLPVSDIQLPSAPEVPKSVLKELAKSVSIAMGDKAVRNTTIGMHVVDLDSGQVLYEHSANKDLKPASNTKLITTACALGIFGADYQFESSLLSRGKVEKGVLNGDLQLYIDHDFTWSTRFYASGDTPLLYLVEQLKAAGIRKVTGNIIVSGYVVYGGQATGTLSTAAHLRSAANRFAAILKRNGISHAGLQIKQAQKPDGKVVAKWLSPVLSEAIVPLNRVSHNEYADMLLLAIAHKVSGKNTYEAGAKAEIDYLRSVGLPVDGIKLKDGSGLSHDNRVSASFFTSLVSWVLKQSGFGREWAASLSISGYDGTYGGRLISDDGKGRVYAKSGTLRDTISGSGFFVNRYDGHTYAFSIMVNGSSNRKLTRNAIDRMVRPFLANYMKTQRPNAPQMTSFRQEADGRVMARWSGAKGAAGYRLYQSNDGGNTWKIAAETKDNALVMPEREAHIRVTAVNSNGDESQPSLIFSYRPGKKMMTIHEMAQCRSDEAMRPDGHVVVHERTLASFIDASWGVETVRDHASPKDGILMHSVACQGKISWDEAAFRRAMEAKIPVIVNVSDAHLSNESKETCDPIHGKVLGCYADAIVTKDRRIGEAQLNYRLRKAAGTGSARPSAVSMWKNAESKIKMAGASVAARADHQGGSVSVVGVDLQAMDSQKSLDAAWRLLGI